MKVFVAGATGVLGNRVVPLLVRAGHQVTAIARTPEKAAVLRAVGAEPVTVGLFEPDRLIAAVAGHGAVVNLATHIPDLSRAARSSAWAENDRIRTEGSRNLVDAALADGALRYVQESISFFYADGGEDWLDEDAALDVPAFAAAILTAEAQAARFAAAGGSGVVLRFGWFYGAGSSHTASQLRIARRGLSPFPGAQDGYQAFVHLDDAASAVRGRRARDWRLQRHRGRARDASRAGGGTRRGVGSPGGPGIPWCGSTRRGEDGVPVSLGAGQQPPLPRGERLVAGVPNSCARLGAGRGRGRDTGRAQPIGLTRWARPRSTLGG